MNDYLFRGIAQSNHRLAVAAYVEPRYNINKDLQFYLGTGAESISFANRAAADSTCRAAFARPSAPLPSISVFGATSIRVASGADNVVTIVGGIAFPGVCPVSAATIFLGNGNVVKKDVSFFEVYGQLTHTINDNWAFDLKEYYTPDFLNSGAWGDYVSVTAKYAAPSTIFGSSGVGLYVSGEFGRQFLGRTDAFYGVPAFPCGIK